MLIAPGNYLPGLMASSLREAGGGSAQYTTPAHGTCRTHQPEREDAHDVMRQPRRQHTQGGKGGACTVSSGMRVRFSQIELIQCRSSVELLRSPKKQCPRWLPQLLQQTSPCERSPTWHSPASL